MAKYVDGFVLVVPKAKRAAYKKMATEGKKIWKKFGVIDYKECRADDMTPPNITFTFPKMAKAKEGEEVWFSYIVFKSKAERNAINKKVMAYMEKKYADSKDMSMPFDMKRMSYGGFTVEVE
jgi:uncharacterized protein YbaA (DUF1428 family)